MTSYTFTNVTTNHTISASFAINTQTITASAGGNGSISPTGSVVVNYGADQVFTITPAANYHVADVLVDVVTAGAVTSYTFTNVTTNHTISASFATDQPALVVLPVSPVDFGSVSVGDVSAPQTLTISNPGTADLVIGTISRDNADFAISNDSCSGRTIAVLGNCTLQTTFTPSAFGVRTATLTIPSSDPGSPTLVTLQGTGEASDIVVSPASPFGFGSVNVGSLSSAQTFTISNAGNIDLIIGSAAVSTAGVNSSEFIISNNTCTANTHIVPSGSCTLDLAFAPSAYGGRTASMSIPTNDPDTQIFLIALNGTGLASNISSTTPVNFGVVNGGLSSAQTLTVNNTGNSALVIATITSSSSEFTISNDTCSGTTVAAWGSCTLDVTFTPAGQGTRTSELQIPSNDPLTPIYTIALSGTGIQYQLSIAGSAGGATGTISGASGVNCIIAADGTTSGTCMEMINPGTLVVLTAAPQAGAYVVWSGCDSSTDTTCSITINADATVTSSFVVKANQTITVTTPAPATAAYNSSFTVAATAPGGSVSYSSAGGCTNVGATFTMTSGTAACSVQYDQAGGTNYNAAAQVTSSTTATKAGQTITATTPAPAAAAYNSSFTVAATAPGGPVSYSSAGGCTNVGATFTMTSGTTACTVQYDQAGDANYAVSQATSSTTATKASQTITATTPAPATAVYNSTFTLDASSTSGLTVSYSSAGGCTNVGATFTMTSGTTACTVQYDQAGDVNYAAAQATSSTTATKASQTITVTTPAPATAAFNSTFTVAATATSGLPVSYSSAGGCTNVGATFTMTSGTTACIVQYDQAGDTNYNAAAQVTNSTTTGKASQTITVTTPAPATTAYNSTFTVAAFSTSGLPVSYSSAGGCTNVGATFTMTSGTTACIVQYDQAGDANYSAAAQVTSSTAAGKENQAIMVTTPAPATAVFNSIFTVAATATSGLPVSYSSAGGCTNVGATFTMTSGTTACVVQYDQAGDANYAAVQVTSATTAVKANQSITVTTPAPATAVYNSTFTVAATATSGLPVSYSSAGGCTNVGATFTMTSGTTACIVQYDQAGDANYSAATQVTNSTTAVKANQTITVTTPAPATAAFNSTFTVAASSTSGLPVSYSSAGGCTNVGVSFTMTSSTVACIVQYDQAGDANYSAATQVTSSTTAVKANQTITVTTPAPATAAFNSTFTVAASSTSGLLVSYSSAGGCTNVGATFTMTSGATACTVQYDQSGDTNYNAAAQVTSSTAAGKENQTITVIIPAPLTASYNSSFTVAATATSGLPVSYSSAGGCTNVGATFTMTSGTTACIVQYDQAGGVNFNAAIQVTSSTTAIKANQTITVTIPAPASAALNSTFTVAATATSGLAVSYSTLGGCTNAGATVTMAAISCVVKYEQAGSADFNIAMPVFTIVTTAPTVPLRGRFSWRRDPVINYLVTFEASIRSDPSLSYVYEWDFGDNQTGVGATVAHQYTDGTTKTVTMKVTSSAGTSATYTKQITPKFRKSNLAVNVPIITTTGQVVTLTDQTTGGYGIVNIMVNWGDGASGLISRGTETTHTYGGVYSHAISVIATDTVNSRIVKYSRFRQTVGPF